MSPPSTDATGEPVTTPPATNATTTTTPLDSLPDCPVDALDSAAGPVEITLWHGLNTDNETAIERVTDEYNASQDRVVVRAENQGGYLETIDKYFQSGTGDRPAIVMFPDYSVQRAIDSEALIPVAACTEAAAYDLGGFQPSAVAAYSQAGVQWGMPFNVSNPVLYYNRNMFVAAGLDPDRPPQSLEELRQYSQQLVDSGAAAYGIAIDSGADSGGGWYIEQWFANMGELYADNGNGRLAPATKVLYDGPAGVAMLTYVQGLITDGLAYYVGDNAGGADQLLKLADAGEPAAMAISTSAGLGTVLNTLAGGLVPGTRRRRRRRRPAARPGRHADGAGRRRRALHHRRQGRRRGRRGVGLHAVPRERRDAVAVGDAHRLRAGARRRARGRAGAQRVRGRPAVPGGLRPAGVVARLAGAPGPDPRAAA